MQKQKKPNIFFLLLISMVAFGFIVGITFPPLVKLYFNTEEALSFNFTIMCLGAGITVGIFNYVLFLVVVSKELRYLVNGMKRVNETIRHAVFGQESIPNQYEIEVKTSDMLGEVAVAFNIMGNSIDERLRREAHYRSIARELSSSVKLTTVTDSILRNFIEATCIQAGLLYGKRGDEMVLFANNGIDQSEQLPQVLDIKHGPAAKAIASGRIVSIAVEPDNLSWFRQSTLLGDFIPKSLRLIPLISENRTAGLIISACGGSEKSEEQTTTTLETYASYMAPYLQNALLHYKIEEMASYDALTGVLNRRFGLLRLKEEVSKAIRYSTPLTLILLDIDQFKNINDTYGHQAGDQVLSNLTQLITNNLRDEEVVCRYGGEEFFVILPLADLRTGSQVADRLRELIQNEIINFMEHQIITTVSLGVASLETLPVNDIDLLIHSADSALYYAKHSGRNRVAFFLDNETILLNKTEEIDLLAL
ncbi:MAG: GGDEF domain-containing protein [Thermodesulfobacteriota bacterium]